MSISVGCKYERYCGKYYALVTGVEGNRVLYDRYYTKDGELYRRNCGLSRRKFCDKYPHPMSQYEKHKSDLDV